MQYLILVLAMLTAGCGVNPKTAIQASAKAVYVDELIRTGAVLDAVISKDLLEADVQIIAGALKNYNDFKELWGAKIKSDPLRLVTDLAPFRMAYEQLRLEYDKVEEVVYRNWDGYGGLTQVVLRDYQSRAVELDKLVMELIGQGKTTTAIIAIEEAAVVLGRIALALL